MNSACWNTLHKLIFNWKFQLLEYWQPLEALEKNSENTTPVWKEFFLCAVDRHEKIYFLFLQLFWLRPFFDPSNLKGGSNNGRTQKSCYKKTIFFMPVNYAKEFLNSLHTGVVFSELFSRASNGRHYSRSWNFQLKISLCSVFQHAEFKFHGCF